MDPFLRFDQWYEEAVQKCAAAIPSACCLSTNGLDGFPNARYVSLKEVLDHKFVVCGPLDSRKGQEISANHRVAITFWWAEAQKQVRVQGEASVLPDQLADQYFSERNQQSQMVSHLSQQGQPIDTPEAWEEGIKAKISETDSEQVPRPDRWGGWMIDPIRIEFLEFRSSRLHRREMYIMEAGLWLSTFLQP